MSDKVRLPFKVTGMDCAEEIAVLKRSVGPVVGGEDKLPFDILNAKMICERTVRFANRPLVGHRLWSVRAALAPAKRITRAAWPDPPDTAVDSGPSPSGFGGPRDSQ